MAPPGYGVAPPGMVSPYGPNGFPPNAYPPAVNPMVRMGPNYPVPGTPMLRGWPPASNAVPPPPPAPSWTPPDPRPLSADEQPRPNAGPHADEAPDLGPKLPAAPVPPGKVKIIVQPDGPPPPLPGGEDVPLVCGDGTCTKPVAPADHPGKAQFKHRPYLWSLLDKPLDFGYACPGPYRLWFRSEFLAWKVSDQKVPDLLQADGVNIIGPGSLNIDDQLRLGGRFTGGAWLNPAATIGLEASFFFLYPETPSRTVTSDGSVLLVRPFFDATTNAEDNFTQVVAGPGTTGSFTVEALSRFYGAEVNSRFLFLQSAVGRLYTLWGARYLQLDESLNMTQLSTTAGTTVETSDRFGTHNSFVGGQFGLDGELFWKGFFVNTYGKVALGQNRQTVHIDGSRIQSDAVLAQGAVGGFYAQQSNIGTYRHESFTVAPEAGINVGYQFGSHVRLMAGYTIIYINNVVRPGDQVDRVINLTQRQIFGFPVPAAGDRPQYSHVESSFWAQGLNVGLELRY